MAAPIIPISVTPFSGGVPKANALGKIAAGWLPDLSGTYAPLVHTHAAADIVSGVLDNARVNWAAPGAIGGTARAAIAGTTGAFNGDLTLSGAPGKIKPAANSTTALQMAQADGTAFATWDSLNKRLRVGDAIAPALPYEVVLTDATTNTINNILRVIHRTSGTPQNNNQWGGGIIFSGDSNTNTVRDMADIVALWGSSVVDGVQVGTLRFRLYSAGVAANSMTLATSGLAIAGSLSISNNFQITAGQILPSDNVNIALGTGVGTKIGTAITQKLGFWNAVPVAQPASAAQAAVATTASTQTTPWGFASQAQADGIITLLNEVQRVLTLTGLWKGAA